MHEIQDVNPTGPKLVNLFAQCEEVFQVIKSNIEGNALLDPHLRIGQAVANTQPLQGDLETGLACLRDHENVAISSLFFNSYWEFM